jgi:PRC-barrel domain protein
MPRLFDPLRKIWRATAGHRRRERLALQIVGGALVIAIATGANPSAWQAAASADAAYGSTQPPEASGSRLQRFAQTDLFRILGKEVHSPSGQAMGRIVDLLVDETGRPQAAIIDFGGFLGVGIRKIALDWHTLRFDQNGKKDAVVADLDRDQIKAAPEYKDSHDVVAIVTAPQSEHQEPAPDRGR